MPKEKLAPDSADLPPAGLRYSSDAGPALRRRDGARGVEYLDGSGRRVRNARILQRIRSLAIPPAWTDVWISADERGHLQATGHDARGRKQYRYHARWREMRDADKFDHMLEFAAALPSIRRRVALDLAAAGMPRRKVLAALVRLLETTCLRVGNARYAEENDSFGLTTLRNRHARVAGPRIEFQFRGKGGKFHRVAVEDPRLARIVRHCRELPGQALFEYLDGDGAVQAIGSADVNDYLREVSGVDITAKDFRTWAGTVFVANELARRGEPIGPSHVVAAVREAARRLGNTPAICRRSYVHPRVLDPETWHAVRRAPRRRPGLRAEEAALLALLAPLRAASRMPRPRRARSSSSPSAAAGRA
jgi:DNA topoisomerase I